MIGGFRMEGEPEINKSEATAEHGITALEEFSGDQIQAIDRVLNKNGKDLENLKNFFLTCEEDNIDTSEFIECLNILSKEETPEELKKLIDEWWSKVF
jgi:hypothetical protein